MMEEKELQIVETKPLTYLCKFDETGRRGETRLACEYTDEQKEAMIADGFVEISQEDWELYCEDGGNKYIRGADGKPTLAPSHVPTIEEKLAALNREYAAEKSRLKDYMLNADLMADDETKAELQEEYTELEAWYDEEYKEIMGGEE